MTEQSKGIVDAIKVCAVLAFVAFLVWMKVGPEIVGIASSVGIIIAYVTRPPKDPPDGKSGAAAIVPFVGIAAIIAELAACTPLEAKQAAASMSFEEEGRDCLRQYQACEERLACRMAVNAKWGKSWNGAATICSKDGGQ